MTRKRFILFILLAMWAAGAAAQPTLLFTPDSWDFGAIREQDGAVSHTFTGVNKGDKPLVILDVVTSCGCTVPEFSRKPVPAGGRAEITITFDPANRPGTFSKQLGVYSSERRKIATLTVQGSVTPRPRRIEESYPVDAGGGVRLSSTLCTFSYIHPGVRAQSSVGFVNTSAQSVRLDLTPQRGSGVLRTDYPRTIAPGERGEINLSYLIPASDPRYGTLRDALLLSVDGRSNGTLVMAHAIGADDPSATPKEKAPIAEFSKNILKFGPVKHDGAILRLPFTLSNTGRGALIVRAVESEGRISTTLAPGESIPPGGTFEAEVTFDPAAQQYGILTDHLLVITNDPARPMRRLRVTAVVEE